MYNHQPVSTHPLNDLQEDHVMAKIKSADSIAEKWSRVTPQRTEDYREGIENPRVDWSSAAAGAEDSWRDGVTSAGTRKAFSNGVKKAGTDKWQRKALEKGTNRFAEGVSLAGEDYKKGFGPFRDTIEKTTLPPRGPKGDPRNIERVRVLSQALRNQKTGG
jgi:hypothetical protein